MVQTDSESTSSAANRRGELSQELDVFDLVHVVGRYCWLILMLCILAAGIVGTLSYLSLPTFVARVSVVPPVQSDRGGGLGLDLLGGAGNSLLRRVMDTTSVADMYVEILQSQVVCDAIVDRFDLSRVYDSGALRDKARRRLQMNTTIKTSKGGILCVTVEDADPNRAAAIANAYIEELDKQNKRLSLGQVSSRRAFLGSRLQEVEQKLSRIDSLPSREAQLQETFYELLMRELELAKIEEAKSMPTIQVLDPAVPPEIRKPRGTIKKAAIAGIVAFVCALFLVFIREYCIECRMHRQRKTGASPEQGRRHLGGDAAGRQDSPPPVMNPA